MRLTDEQREWLHKNSVKYKNVIYDCRENEAVMFIGNRKTATMHNFEFAVFIEDLLTIHLPDVLSSERAWKEEAERLQERLKGIGVEEYLTLERKHHAIQGEVQRLRAALEGYVDRCHCDDNLKAHLQGTIKVDCPLCRWAREALSTTEPTREDQVRDTTQLIFIGDKYYMASGSIMSSLYEEGTGKRYDWGFVQRDLREGVSIEIRPATAEEVESADKQLEEITSRFGEIEAQAEGGEFE